MPLINFESQLATLALTHVLLLGLGYTPRDQQRVVMSRPLLLLLGLPWAEAVAALFQVPQEGALPTCLVPLRRTPLGDRRRWVAEEDRVLLVWGTCLADGHP